MFHFVIPKVQKEPKWILILLFSYDKYFFKSIINSRMPRHSCCEVRVMQLHDILLLRTSASLHTLNLYSCRCIIANCDSFVFVPDNQTTIELFKDPDFTALLNLTVTDDIQNLRETEHPFDGIYFTGCCC